MRPFVFECKKKERKKKEKKKERGELLDSLTVVLKKKKKRVLNVLVPFIVAGAGAVPSRVHLLYL